MSNSTVQFLYNGIRTPNMLPDRSADVHLDPDVNLADVSLTQQHFAQECDINYILRNNALVAPLTPEQYASQRFEDLGDSIDYHTAKNYLFEANNAFMSLDASVRARFDNDPGKFLDFVQDGNNRDELIKMGLAVSKPSTEVFDSSVPPAKDGDEKPISKPDGAV